MAPRGRRPKPVELKVLEGNPGKRPLNDNRPRPAPKAPKCPEWLDEVARAEWRRVAPHLERLGLLTELDRTALAAYCVSYSQYQACQKVIAGKGMTQGGPSGRRSRPEVRIAFGAMQSIRLWAAEFGMTPSSRGRMVVPGAEGNDHDPEGVLS